MKSEINVSCVESEENDHTKEQQELSPQADNAVKAWPTQPKPLELSSLDQLCYFAYDGALIALPILLIIKTGLCIFASFRDKYASGPAIENASYMSRALVNFNSQLVTLFTIVFVTIVSTYVKRLALWRAQQGAYVADLEQLQGSVSLPSTLKLIWSLRSFGLKSILLVLAWSFYYLGSQAAKLEYQLSLSENYHNMKGAVVRSDAPSYFNSDPATVYDGVFPGDGGDFWSLPGRDLDHLNTYFEAILLELGGGGGQRFASNNPGSRHGPLIPYYGSAVEQAHESVADKVRRKVGGWISTARRGDLSFTSDTGTLLWLAMSGIQDGQVQYALDASNLLGSYTLHNISYMMLDCNNLTTLPLSAFPDHTDATTSASLNMTAVDDKTPRDSNGYLLREFIYSFRGWFKDPPNGTDPTTTLAPSPNWEDPRPFNRSQRTLQTTCGISTKYIDMEVSCIPAGCYCARLRWSNNTDEIKATSYSTPFDDDVFSAKFLDNLIRSTGRQNDQHSSTLVGDKYMGFGTLNDSFWSTYGPTVNQERFLSSEEFNWKLSTGINTYYTLSQIVVNEKVPPNFDTLHGNITNTDPNPQDKFFKLVDVKGASYDPRYRLSWAWAVIDIASCLVLLGAAIGSYRLRTLTLAPDIFGFVSSLTRGNPHIQLPSEGSTLTGIERARKLKHVKVKIGNVQEVTAEGVTVGTIGLAPVEAVAVQPLRRAQVYQ